MAPPAEHVPEWIKDPSHWTKEAKDVHPLILHFITSLKLFIYLLMSMVGWEACGKRCCYTNGSQYLDGFQLRL